MKTPRQILFEKHQAISPKLDLIRKQSVPTAPGKSQEASIPWKLWLELIWPARRIWSGMAGCWMVIAVLNFSTPGEGLMMAGSTLVNRMTMAELQEQNRLLTQLLRGDEGGTSEAEEPVRNRTRSDIRSKQMVG